MRDIKFRAFIPNFGMTDQITIYGDDGSWIASIGTREWYSDDGGNLMQYTGLKDKNGKDIYEGDIVDDGSGIGVVHFKAPGFIVCNPQGEFWLGRGLSYPEVENTLKETLVVGNIHENAELLKNAL